MFFNRVFSHWKISLSILLVISIIVVIFIIQVSNKQTGYIFDSAKKTTITEIVTDSGKILSDGRVEVNSPTNGIITELYVTNGQQVKEGANLFSVKSSATVQEQQTAYANYQAAVAAQNAAETLLHTYRSAMFVNWKEFTDLSTNSTYESSKGVPNLNARNAAEFQTAQENWLGAEKQFIDQEQAVAAAQAQVNATWTAYLATKTAVVTAPINGTVTNLTVAVGKSVTTPTILNPASTPVLTIVNSTNVETVLNVGQTDIAKVKIGQAVKIHPDPYKDKEYDGTVTRVDTLGQDLLGVVTYNVYIDFSSPDEFLRPEMSVDGDIITNKQENVLTVPNSAVVLYKDGKAVRILKNNEMVYVPVLVGMKGETRTQILSGLSDGQQVISSLTNEKAARPSFMGL